jgi:hypothetical protein
MRSRAMDDLFKAEEAARLAADSLIRPDQIIGPGCYCVRIRGELTVYSEILDAATFLLGDREEYEDTQAMYKEPHMRFYRFTRSYSRMCPEGEYGDIHLCEIRQITKEEFLQARKNEWP